MKQKIKQMLPVLLVIAVCIATSAGLYYKVTEYETDKCWQLLDDSVEAANREIKAKFNDSIAILNTFARSIVREGAFEKKTILSEHLNDYEKNTVFSRIDIIYPDNTVMLKDSVMTQLDDITFDEIASKGVHMSSRRIDKYLNNEAIYYFLPVCDDNGICLILVGVVDLVTLVDYFEPKIYNGEANICIIDSGDGNFLMDNWHDEFINVYDTPEREKIKGYENVDTKDNIRHQRESLEAFISKSTGEIIYIKHIPMHMFDWMVSVFVTENVAFANVIYLKKCLIIAGIIEFAMLLVYLLWNVSVVNKLEESKSEALKQLNISTTLIRFVTELSSDNDIDVSIRNLLQTINQYFDADSSYIFEYNAQQDIFANTYEYTRQGIKSQSDMLQNVPAASLSTMTDSFNSFKNFYISDISHKNSDAINALRKNKTVDRLLAVPLRKGTEIIGFVGVDNPNRFYDDTSLLLSTQYFITNSLQKQKQQDRLKYISYQDMLTAMYNRNKYIQFLTSNKGIVLEKIGVAYIDLNGLKEINDKQGHEAGDEFICKSARVISDIFPKTSYRIGGDEFVIIENDIANEDFSEKIRKLQSMMENEKISISLGYLWRDTCDDPEKMLKEADKLMYEEKERYYQSKE